MNPEQIIVLSGSTIDYLLAVLATARHNGQDVKVCVDGGFKVKRGESMWTPPLGHTLASEE